MRVTLCFSLKNNPNEKCILTVNETPLCGTIMLFHRDSYRLIVAGGGTGGVTAFVGEQLNHTSAEIVYLDFSKTSMKIAQTRVRNRKLSKIVWIQSWIEGVRYLGMGLFDDLQCSGVLHHLKSPSYGLNVLKECLTINGKMELMVYAKYGRTGVYQIQHLMKMINSNEYEIQNELLNTNHTLNALPENNWFVLNSNINDHRHGNIGIYDLLLHKRDVAFSIKTLFEWIGGGSLHFVDFDYYVQRFYLKIQYVFSDHDIKRKLSILYTHKQMYAAELLQGRICQHSFYASKTKYNVADIHDQSNMLYIYGKPRGMRETIANKNNYKIFENKKYFKARMSERVIIQTQWNSWMLPYDDKEGKMSIEFGFKANPFNQFLVDRLLDSNRGVKLKNVYSEYRKTLSFNISNDELHRLTDDFYNSVKDTEMFLLKDQSINPFPKTSFLTLWQINST